MEPMGQAVSTATRTDADDFAVGFYEQLDAVRRMQGCLLDAAGFGPCESAYEVTTAGPRWRLRHYGGAGAAALPLLIVAAPIKRPYIWDIAPTRSALRICRERGFDVYMLEWLPPDTSDAKAGIAAHALDAIGAAVTRVSRDTNGHKPVLMGHSLGGTLAALHAAVRPEALAGLVLLSAPLAFAAGTSAFRDAIAALAPGDLAGVQIVPGSLLSHLSAMADPMSFVWSRMGDIAATMADPSGLAMETRVERWALDELPLPAALVAQTLGWLYREDRFGRGLLNLNGGIARPAGLRLPCLVVTNTADTVAGPETVQPVVDAIPDGYAKVITYPGETGVGLQHLAVLVGRDACSDLWPRITDWIGARG